MSAKAKFTEGMRRLRANGPFRALAAIVVLILVFAIGDGVGSGRIHVGSHYQNIVAGGLPDQLDYKSVNEVYQALRGDYDGKLTQAQLLDGMKEGLAQATGDPYTEYFSVKDAEDFNNQLNNSFSGIGAELGKDAQGNLQIVSPIAGFPADKAGLKAQDIIESVNGHSTNGWSVDEAVNKIRGPKGTKVTLKVIRDKSRELTITITRGDIKVPSVNSKILDGNIGYMQITVFSDDTAELAQKAAQQFADAHVKGVVLDLRGDPGGLLDAAIKVSSLWLPEGKTILQEKRGGVVTQTYKAEGNDTLTGVPTVVLIDQGSASASEITAGALHDNGVARLMGVKSYGKGSVQQIENFADGSEMKITVARWYRPNGQNIDKKGITPDQTVKISDDDLKKGNDTQKQAAIDYLNK